MVRAQALLLRHLCVERLSIVIGGSIGGMQALQWAVDFPEQVGTAVAIGATPLSAMGLALNHLQRQVIQLDPEWRGGHYERAARPRTGDRAFPRHVYLQVGGPVPPALRAQAQP